MTTTFSTTQENTRPVSRRSHGFNDASHSKEVNSWAEFLECVNRFKKSSRHWNDKPSITAESADWPLPAGATRVSFPNGTTRVLIPGEIQVEYNRYGEAWYSIL